MTSTRMVLGDMSCSGTGVVITHTVPAGAIDTVEYISANRYGPGTHHVEFGSKRGGVFYAFQAGDVRGDSGVLTWYGKQVLEAGDQLYSYNPNGDTINFWASGFRVT